jgi:protein-tyrosine phosphatase
MDGYVDIHAHVLPGIDDGPDDLEQSLAMARAAADSGIATIASTPHLRTDFPDVHVHELAHRCRAMREVIEAAGVPVRLVSGAEVSLSWALDATDEELALASYGQRGTDLLVETPTVNPVGIDRLLYVLRAKGYRLTLAHPERSVDFQQDSAPLRGLVTQGVLLQLNAGSLLGPGGVRGVKSSARELLTGGLAHAIASDAHRGDTWRPITRLPEAVRAAAELVGADRAEWMAKAAPMAIIDGGELPDPPAAAARARPRRRLFGFALR